MYAPTERLDLSRGYYRPGIKEGTAQHLGSCRLRSFVSRFAGNAESGIEVDKVKMGAGAQGEDRAVYLAMHNHDSTTDQLTGASSDAAEITQLQNGTEVGDVIPAYANTEFVFIRDGYHVMLVGLKQELHVGDEIEVVLHFRDHEELTISVPVGEAIEHEHEH